MVNFNFLSSFSMVTNAMLCLTKHSKEAMKEPRVSSLCVQEDIFTSN